MQEEVGTVVEVKSGFATVRVGRHEECSGCGACGAARAAMVEAKDAIGAKPGARVRFVMPEHSVVLGAFIVFALPLLLALLGGLLGWHFLTEPLASEGLAATLGAVLGFVLGWVIIKLFDHHVGQQQPYLTEILRQG